MKIPAVAMFLAVMVPAAEARQAAAPVQYVIEARVFAANPQAPDAAEVVAAPTFRTAAGRTASMDLSDSAGARGLRLAVTPSDLGAGKVGVRVVVELRRGGQTATSTFDVLTGDGTTVATVALRDATGAFLLDDRGRALYAGFKTVNAFAGAYKPGDGVSWPEVVSEAKPEYTAAARAANVRGQVELEIVVQSDGTVGDIRVTKSLDRTYGLDDAAIAAAKKWRFKPGLKERVAVATRVGLVLEFR